MKLQLIQKHLLLSLEEIHLALLRYIERSQSGLHASYELSDDEPPKREPETPLTRIVSHFKLSQFERAILLLCAGVELESALVSLCATAQGDPQRTYPTFSLALSALPSPHWSALSPNGALRRHQLIRLEPGGMLTTSPLRIEERVLHALVGLSFLDEKLAKLMQPVRALPYELESYQEASQKITRAWEEQLSLPILLYGTSKERRRQFAAFFCREIGYALFAVSLSSLPLQPAELVSLQECWSREAGLFDCVLLLENDTDNEPAREALLAWWVERSAGPLLLSCEQQALSARQGILSVEIKPCTEPERQRLWQRSLASFWREDPAPLARALAYQFSMSEASVIAICEELERQASEEGPEAQALAAWELCRSQSRGQLEALSQRLSSSVGWADLVLPAAHLQTMRQITAQVRQRYRVYEEWGFAQKTSSGLGVSALFSGASGTGKTLAAQVLSNELSLDLYRIDLSSVVSKYIGETEKNLRKIFDSAEESGAILLFDEADALFGKRSEVKDSHDRHANIEVSYLLQRMESYRGLAILTTNMKEALDVAFLRRIRFVVPFPFPDATQRTELWRRAFPPSTPTEGLDPAKLARWNVSGGSIRNIAMNAAFLAAEQRSSVTLEHVILAAESEYAKLEKPFTEAELRGLR